MHKRGSAPPKVAYRGVCFRDKKMVGIERFVKNKSKEKKIENFLPKKINLETPLCATQIGGFLKEFLKNPV